MNFNVAGIFNLLGFELLIPSQAVLEQSKVPAWVPSAMLDPASQENETPVDVIAISVDRILFKERPNLTLQLRHYPFIRVDDQYPFITKRKVLQGPVLLLRKSPA